MFDSVYKEGVCSEQGETQRNNGNVSISFAMGNTLGKECSGLNGSLHKEQAGRTDKRSYKKLQG